MSTITADNFTRVRNDVNGNPRYVLHFLHLSKDGDAKSHDISGKYAAAIKRANKIGGRKFHNNQYGGGIVFQSYSLPELCQDLNNMMRGPLVWGELWDAMKASPDEWIETTEEMFFEMLEAVPPRKQGENKFLVGEAARHNEQGEAVYSCFKQVGAKFYAKDMTVAQYASV